MKKKCENSDRLHSEIQIKETEIREKNDELSEKNRLLEERLEQLIVENKNRVDADKLDSTIREWEERYQQKCNEANELKQQLGPLQSEINSLRSDSGNFEKLNSELK